MSNLTHNPFPEAMREARIAKFQRSARRANAGFLRLHRAAVKARDSVAGLTDAFEAMTAQARKPQPSPFRHHGASR